MKKLIACLGCVALILAFTSPVIAGGKSQCTTIQSGELVDSKGYPIETGYDQWGYNYQAHLFNGFYDNASRPEIPVTEGDKLVMKWNDAWLSNKDCNDDLKLDRPSDDGGTYIGSGAWCTNHMSGVYEAEDGTLCSWVEFVKIVAVPGDATSLDGIWYDANGEVIGPVIWGSFAIVQDVYNDACAGEHGVMELSPVGPGLGKFK